MPKVKEPQKVRYILRDGPSAGYIGDMLEPLPKKVYVPLSPADVSETPEGAQWSVGEYRLSDEQSEDPSIAAVYHYVA